MIYNFRRITTLNYVQCVLIIILTTITTTEAGEKKKPASPIKELTEIAKNGDASAQFRLSSVYFSGSMGIEVDHKKAVYWLKKSAAKGYPVAEYELGRCYELGHGLDVDTENALTHYKAAGEKGNELAQIKAATMLKDRGQFDESARYYYLAARNDNAIALTEIGRMLLYGTGVEKNTITAIKNLTKAAELGNDEARLLLAESYSGSIEGVQADLENMIRYLWEAASNNLPAAQSKLGYCYEEGIGVRKNTDLAVKWYTKAAEQEHPHAIVNLGHCYASGRGVAMDPVKAFELYEKATDWNIPEALYNVGVCYARGIGIQQNIEQAIRYLKHAANLNDSNATYQLGLLFEKGLGSQTPNAESAFLWYKKSADGGDIRGLKALARCYFEGIGTPKNESEGEKYFQRALNKSK